MELGEELELIGIDPEIWSYWLLNQEHLGRRFEKGQLSLYVKNEHGQMRRVQRVFVQLDDEIGVENCPTKNERNQT